MNMVQSKLGVQMPQLDWFSDLGCKTKRVSVKMDQYFSVLCHAQHECLGKPWTVYEPSTVFYRTLAPASIHFQAFLERRLNEESL